MSTRPLALITGASRRAGLGAAIAMKLAEDGWDIATTYWTAYDGSDRQSSQEELDGLRGQLAEAGAATEMVEADLSQPESPVLIFSEVEKARGPVTALILSHCHGESSHVFDTTVESFDLHFAVNARASWLLIKEFGQRYKAAFGQGRVIALTSDHVVGNLPYGASKGALDRITLAAAYDFQDKGITANVVNPGPIDTGWMSDELKRDIIDQTPLRRAAAPSDCANIVRFLCSPEGGWVNGQLIKSDGGFQAWHLV